MRTWGLALVVSTCLGVLHAQTIKFNSLTLDLGSVKSNLKVKGVYQVSNQGKVYLQISELRPSCGCTSTVVGQWALQPQESSLIEVTLDTTGLKGDVTKSIQVVSNDPQNPTTLLTLKAKVIPDLDISQEAVFWVNLAEKPVARTVIRFHSNLGQRLDINSVETRTAPWVTTSTRVEGKDVLLILEGDARKINSKKRYGIEVLNVEIVGDLKDRVPIKLIWELD
ncbi:MAG: DUF1573 domain-containing protein [Holophagaceae bacterium]